MSAPSSTPQPRTKWPVAIAIGAATSMLLAIVMLAFLWPGKTSETHNLPVSIAGPAESVTALETALGAAETFDFIAANDRADAVAQIQTRQTYGAIILGSGTQPPEVLTTPAGSAAAAQMLTGVATQLQTQMAQQLTIAGADPSAAKVSVTPIVPLSADDSTGAGLASASFPLAIGGMIGGVLISLLIIGPIRRLAALGGYAVAAGLLSTFIMQTWFHYLQGDFWVNALAMGLTMLATAAFIVGCTSLLGRAGIALGAILTMFVGNPIAATATPWQFLPEPWGVIGQYMVPGASGSLMRTLSYFPEASGAQQWWTLSTWAAVGIVLTLIGHFRSKSTMQVPESTLDSNIAPALANA